MNKIYSDSEEKLVKTVLVYADADEGHLFFDKEKKQKITKDELFNLFLKGVTVFMSDEYFNPTTYKENAGAGMLTVVKDSGDSATLYNFYSAEHEA